MVLVRGEGEGQGNNLAELVEVDLLLPEEKGMSSN